MTSSLKWTGLRSHNPCDCSHRCRDAWAAGGEGASSGARATLAGLCPRGTLDPVLVEQSAGGVGRTLAEFALLGVVVVNN